MMTQLMKRGDGPQRVWQTTGFIPATNWTNMFAQSDGEFVPVPCPGFLTQVDVSSARRVQPVRVVAAVVIDGEIAPALDQPGFAEAVLSEGLDWSAYTTEDDGQAESVGLSLTGEMLDDEQQEE